LGGIQDKIFTAVNVRSLGLLPGEGKVELKGEYLKDAKQRGSESQVTKRGPC